MAVLKAFKGLRPPADLAKQVASRPYDVLNSVEAREEAKGNPCEAASSIVLQLTGIPCGCSRRNHSGSLAIPSLTGFRRI